MEKNAKGLLDSLEGMKNGDKVLKNLDKLKSFASSPQGKALIMSLGAKGVAATESAADAMKKGDTAGLSEMISKLLSTKEGREIAAKIVRLTGIE